MSDKKTIEKKQVLTPRDGGQPEQLPEEKPAAKKGQEKAQAKEKTEAAAAAETETTQGS